MDISQLRAFAAVAKHSNFTRAADEIHLSQPTVSGQIKMLEEALGVQLFERRPGGVILTGPGAELLPRAKHILAQVHDFIVHAQDLGGNALRTIKLGVPSDAKFLKVGYLLNEMRLVSPNVTIEVHHASSGLVMENVKRGDFDCGYFFGPSNQKSFDVDANFIATITYRIVGPVAWADRISAAGWKEIAAMPWIWAPAGGAYVQIAEEMFREHGVEPNKTTVADRESTIVNLATSGVGLALLREGLASTIASNNEVVMWEHGIKGAALSFIVANKRRDDPVMGSLTQIVQKLWA